MDWSSIPSLNALKAFSAVAEAGSYSGAGTMLNVTHAAVMQQVKSLEGYFRLQLVTRSGRGVVLTEEGALLGRGLETGFRHIQKGIEALTGAELLRPVQVTMSPAFAVKWLMPRLANFQSQHPEITLLLNPSGKFMELQPGGIELAIRYSPRETLAEGADVLIVGDLVVVGTSELIGTRDISDPSDLVHLPWLQELGTNEVTDWLTRHGVTLDRPLIISHMPGNLIMDAVKRGDGITYTLRQWVADEIRSGELVELFPEERHGVFYIHTLPGEKRLPVRQFIKWLKQQAADAP
jgi:LysR family glycine cleavage system transcriptional activator